MRKLQVPIMGEKWEVSVLDEDAFERRFKEQLAGMTIPDLRQIFITDSDFTYATVAHELGHAMYSELCTKSANLTPDQVEEIFCEIIGEHGRKIHKLTLTILKRLKE